MPELPEVETTRRTVEPYVLDQCLQDVKIYNTQLRLPVPSAKLRRLLQTGIFKKIRRRGKYLLFDVHHPKHQDVVLLMHLGMTGKLGILTSEEDRRKHDHLIFFLSNDLLLAFNDVRRFGLVDIFLKDQEQNHPRLAILGKEPLEDPLPLVAYLKDSAVRFQKPIKNFLMDHRFLVGVGNIYASEALHMAGLHPMYITSALHKKQWHCLVLAIQKVLRKAIAAGGTTLKDFQNVRGEAGYFSQSLQVYGREAKPCYGCGRLISKIVMAGRSTFFCSGCQGAS